MRRFVRPALVTVVLATLLASPLGIVPSVWSQDGGQPSGEPDVLAPSAAPPATPEATREDAEIGRRQRFVRADLSLFPNPRKYGAHRRLSLRLFNDVRLRLELEQAEKISPGVVSWVGHVRGIPLSDVVLVVTDKHVMSGTITMPGHVYNIQWAGDGIHAVTDVDPAELPPDRHAHPPDDIAQSEPEGGGAPAQGVDDGPRIDVMVIYSDDARSAAGGVAQIESQVNVAVQNTNAAYQNSGVAQRINLVHQQEMTYSESSSCSTNLNRVTFSDGYLDDVQGLRNTYGADLVVLVTQNGDCGGIAWIMSSPSSGFAPYGYSVVRRSGLPFLTFAHELGHNMGADHDAWTLKNLEGNRFNGAYSYSRGFVDPSSPKTWASVMAYTQPCASDGCTRIAYFSNPNLVMDGDPMGIPEGLADAADNTRTLNNTAALVAGFRMSYASPPGAASGITPSGAITTKNPTFSWSRVAEASQYRLWLDGPSGHVYDVWRSASTCGASTCSTTPTLNLPNGAYTWKVLTSNPAGDGPWSADMSFGVYTPPGKASLVSPSGSGKDNPLTYVWNAVSGATWYQLLVNGPTGAVIQNWFTSAEVCSGTTCSVTPATSLLVGSYKWYIQTRNEVDGPWSSSKSFSVRKPLTASLVSPSGSGIINPVTYRWKKVTNATWYQLQVKRSDTVLFDMWLTSAEVCPDSYCSITPATSLSPGSHSWRIRTRNDAGDGSWSSSKSFSVS